MQKLILKSKDTCSYFFAWSPAALFTSNLLIAVGQVVSITLFKQQLMLQQIPLPGPFSDIIGNQCFACCMDGSCREHAAALGPVFATFSFSRSNTIVTEKLEYVTPLAGTFLGQ